MFNGHVPRKCKSHLRIIFFNQIIFMKTVLSIPGMHCDSCAALIKDVSSEFPAIKTVEVDLKTKRVILNHSEDLDLAAWSKEIEALGEKYKVTPLL